MSQNQLPPSNQPSQSSTPKLDPQAEAMQSQTMDSALPGKPSASTRNSSSGDPPPPALGSTLSGKPQRDWLQLLIIPVTLIVITSLFGGFQAYYSFKLSDLQHSNDIALAADQQRETSVDNYLNNISMLLTNPDLRSATAKDGPDLRSLARAQTLTVLSELGRDGARKARVVLFLHDANLINRGDSSLPFPVVSLAGADLLWSALSGFNLGGANLATVNLST